ncbi:nitrophenyl compound nitroreductase subunit ArsF family protein [Bacteroidota bacterium]
MKILKPSLLIMFAALSLLACNAQTSENQNAKNVISENVQVYYFHNTARCATCNAVENETKKALEMFYADKMKAGTMDFISLNLQEDEGEKMAQTLHVSGQTLLIVKGVTHLNLTNEGFMNARTNPDKFHDILKTQIDKLL